MSYVQIFFLRRQNQPANANGPQQSSPYHHQNSQIHHQHLNEQPDAALRIQDLVRSQMAIAQMAARVNLSQANSQDLSPNSQYRHHHHNQYPTNSGNLHNLQNDNLTQLRIEQAIRLGSELSGLHHQNQNA